MISKNFGGENFPGRFLLFRLVMKLYRLLFEQPEKTTRKVSLGVLTFGNKVLILKRSMDSKHGGKWGFPGGGIDADETAFKAIIRECEEEIGVRPINLIKLSQNGRITWFRGMLPCDPAECVGLNGEHDEWALVGLEEVVEYDMIAGMEEMIKHVVSR